MAAFNRARAPSRFRISEWARTTGLSVCQLADARHSSKPPAVSCSQRLVNRLPESVAQYDAVELPAALTPAVMGPLVEVPATGKTMVVNVQQPAAPAETPTVAAAAGLADAGAAGP